ncbi:MAG: hypothetical protein AAGU74_00830 [Bacillota bacterium]
MVLNNIFVSHILLPARIRLRNECTYIPSSIRQAPAVLPAFFYTIALTTACAAAALRASGRCMQAAVQRRNSAPEMQKVVDFAGENLYNYNIVTNVTLIEHM